MLLFFLLLRQKDRMLRTFDVVQFGNELKRVFLSIVDETNQIVRLLIGDEKKMAGRIEGEVPRKRPVTIQMLLHVKNFVSLILNIENDEIFVAPIRH